MDRRVAVVGRDEVAAVVLAPPGRPSTSVCLTKYQIQIFVQALNVGNSSLLR